MLKSIYADGFKSLMNFSLPIQEGLNIFVGPNGSGKTNIVLLFEFISYLTEEPIAEAIIRAGGVSSVFRRYGDDAKMSSITIRLYGEYNFYRFVSTRAHSRKGLYQYEFVINRSSETGLVYFEKQDFKLCFTTAGGAYRRTKTGDPRWDLEIASDVNDTLRPRVVVRKIDTKKIRPQIFTSRHPTRVITRYLESRIVRTDPSAFSLIQLVADLFPEIRNIRSDLYSGRAYNVIPNIVKAREDAVFPVGVQANGAGTSATLFTLWKIAQRQERRTRPARTFQGRATARPLVLSEGIYREVIELLRLVNNSIQDIDVFVDPYDNVLRINFAINTDDGLLQIPLQNMSDGTAKWLALTIAILSNRGVFAIEEPENFLHPYMQKEILQIIRETMSERGRRGFAIITTHSETLLNAARPTELVLVKMEAGNTVLNRLHDPELIDNEIKRSGFGLGYLYLTGVLSHA